MKIIHVISALTKGGGERVVAELANEAAEMGDQVCILAAWPANPDFLQNSLHPNIKVEFIALSKKTAYLKVVIWIIKNRDVIKNQDVIHCHLTFGSLFGAIVKILLTHSNNRTTPIIVDTNHAVGMAIPKFNRWVYSKLLKRKDGLILMARDPYWDNFTKVNPKLRYTVIPNGIKLLTPVKNELINRKFKKENGIDENCKYLIGTVSMLRPDRKPDLYVSLFKNIYDVLGNDAHFILGGDGIELQNIKDLIETYKLRNYVHLPGSIKVAPDTMKNLDIYISLSVGSAAGISMIEAAMCKVPVIGIQLLENYVAKDSDWVWSHTDLQKVSERIIYLLKDERERKKVIEEQSNYVTATLTSDAMYASYNLFYKTLIQKMVPKF